MANIKITDLPELSETPNDANLLEIVDKASETPTSKKITWANIKAAVLTAVGKVNEAVGFTLSGGTTSKTLTVEDTSVVNQDLTTDASPTFANITDSGLTALQMVCTDADKKLVSKPFSGSTKALAGTDTASAMTPADVAAANAVLAREPDQGVAMTYAASGSSGIQVADNDNIDFGTGNFTLVWRGSLPDWTPTTSQYLYLKYANYFGHTLLITPSGNIAVQIGDGVSDVKTFISSIVNTFVNGTTHKITASITVGASNTTCDFSVDGLPFGAQQTNANGASVSTATALCISGSSTIRTASTTHFAATYNRALTAAEVLDLYRNGIAESDKWGSQTAVYTSDFSAGVDGWTISSGSTVTGNVDTDADGTGLPPSDNWLKCERTGGTTGYAELGKIISVGIVKKRVKITATIFNPPESLITYFMGYSGVVGDGYSTPVAIATGTTATVNFETYGGSSGAVLITPSNGATYVAIANGQKFYVKDITVTEIGATLALEAEGIQPAPGQWLDSSSNKNHAMQPATGSNLTRYKKDFEYRWTNTWTASSAAQYVGGLNQAVLSADHFITDIITQATVVTDVENLELGDGSAVAKFVAAFTPSATRTKQTVAAQNDGTNLKLVYTPAAEATMTVETIIRGFIWEP